MLRNKPQQRPIQIYAQPYPERPDEYEQGVPGQPSVHLGYGHARQQAVDCRLGFGFD